MTHRCPPIADLTHFCRGQIPEDAASTIADHLDACATCLETIANLSATGDVMLDQLRDAPPELHHHHEEGLEQLQGKLRKLVFASPQSSDEATAPHIELTQLREYQLLDQIGAGGMGSVYRARHTKLDRIAAIKVLPPERTKDDEAVARFEREMRAVAKLDHPNIVRAMDAGEVDDTHFLVMEFVDGSDLAKVCQQHGPLSIADACAIIGQAANGLAVAHQHGIVHRDVKPSNLMLAKTIGNDGTPSVIVKVLDLGLALLGDVHATSVDHVTASGQIMGTLEFMAPEQCADSHEVDQRADVYSLGVTLYKLLCGESPFSSRRYSSFGKRFFAITTEVPPSVRDVRPDVPVKLSNYIDRLLAKSPDDRPASVQDVAQFLLAFSADANLNALLSSEHVGVRRGDSETLTVLRESSTTKHAAPVRTRDPNQGRRRILAGAALATTVIVAAAVGWMQFGRGDATTSPSTDEPRQPPLAIAPFDASQAHELQQAWADHLQLPLEKNIELPDGTTLAFVLIPPGEFNMGADNDELASGVQAAREMGIFEDIDAYLKSQTPRHVVKISRAFYLGKFEVTQQQWTAIREDNPSMFAGYPNRPVEQVEYNEVARYVGELNSLMPQQDAWFALPTEAQWE